MSPTPPRRTPVRQRLTSNVKVKVKGLLNPPFLPGRLPQEGMRCQVVIGVGVVLGGEGVLERKEVLGALGLCGVRGGAAVCEVCGCLRCW